MLTHFLKLLLLMLSLALPFWLMVRLIAGYYHIRIGNKINLQYELLLILFIIYITGTLAVTIVPASISNFSNPRQLDLNLIPIIYTCKYFISTLSEPDNTSTYFALENIIGNLILFIPLGIFLPLLFANFRKFKKVVIISFLCSLVIECTQHILRQFGTYRTVDIDDIILNTLGAMIGWFIFSKLLTRYLFRGSIELKNMHNTDDAGVEKIIVRAKK